MSTTPTERPSETNRTPPETTAAIASAIVTLSTGPTETFGAFFNNEERYSQYEQLIDCLTTKCLSDDVPILWSQAKRDDVDERLTASLSTDEDGGLFDQLGDHNSNAGGIREDAAYLVGVEVGRRASGVTAEPVSTTADDTAPDSTLGDHSKDVSGVMIRLVSALWLAKSVSDCQIGDVAKVNHYAWFALSDLLEAAATDLDAAHGRYCTESNALHAAAESGGAR